MIAEQTVLARASTIIYGSANNENKTENVSVACTLLEGPNKGEQIEYVGWLTEKTEARTAESLALFGYDGEHKETISRNVVALVIEHEEYETKDVDPNTGVPRKKKRAKVKWVNDAERGGAKFAAIDPARELQLKQRLKGLILAQQQAKPQKATDAAAFNFGANQQPPPAGPAPKF